MAKVLYCDDLVRGCEAVVHADSEDEVLSGVAVHARDVHGLAELDDATVAAARAAIREQ